MTLKLGIDVGGTFTDKALSISVLEMGVMDNILNPTLLVRILCNVKKQSILTRR